MAIKYIKNSAFVHIKIVHVRSSYNDIIPEFGIIESLYNLGRQLSLVLVSEIEF